MCVCVGERLSTIGRESRVINTAGKRMEPCRGSPSCPVWLGARLVAEAAGTVGEAAAAAAAAVWAGPVAAWAGTAAVAPPAAAADAAPPGSPARGGCKASAQRREWGRQEPSPPASG